MIKIMCFISLFPKLSGWEGLYWILGKRIGIGEDRRYGRSRKDNPLYLLLEKKLEKNVKKL